MRSTTARACWIIILFAVVNGIELVGGSCSKHPEQACEIGVCLDGLCAPCTASTCESPSDCSLDGIRTECRKTSKYLRNWVKDDRNRVEARCSQSCVCSPGHCNSDSECSAGSVCHGSIASSQFSPDDSYVCQGSCLPNPSQSHRSAQGVVLPDGFDDEETVSGVPSAAPTADAVSALPSSDTTLPEVDDADMATPSAMPTSDTSGTTNAPTAATTLESTNTASTESTGSSAEPSAAPTGGGTETPQESGSSAPTSFTETGSSTLESGSPSQSPVSMDTNTTECSFAECTSDIDCNDESFCSGQQEDIPCSGTCMLFIPIDVFDGNSTCSNQTCTDEDDCLNAEICLGGVPLLNCSGVCTSLTNATQCDEDTCQNDLDCLLGAEFCFGADDSNSCSGLCIPLSLEEGNSTCTGFNCTLDSDCSDTEQCADAIFGMPCSGLCESIQNVTENCPAIGGCESDLDCTVGLEVCTKQLDSDICGVCMIPDMDGSNGDCPIDTCRTDDDCSTETEVCEGALGDFGVTTECSGTCASQNNTAVICTSPLDCQTGLETCVGLDIFTGEPGTCAPITCTALLTCGSDADCFDGLETCEGFDGVTPCSGQCVHRNCAIDQRTDSCSADTDCPTSSYECVGFDGSSACSGTCALMVCPGVSCSTSSECASGQKCSGANGVDACSGTCETVSLRFRNYRGTSVPHFGKGFDFGSLFFSNRSILLGGSQSTADDEVEDLSSFLER